MGLLSTALFFLFGVQADPASQDRCRYDYNAMIVQATLQRSQRPHDFKCFLVGDRCPQDYILWNVINDHSSGLGVVGAPADRCTPPAERGESFDLEATMACDPVLGLNNGRAPKRPHPPFDCHIDPPVRRLVTAEYYYLSNRIKFGIRSDLEAVASIDYLLEQPSLEGIDACFGRTDKLAFESCQSLKGCRSDGGATTFTNMVRFTQNAATSFIALKENISEVKDRLREISHRKSIKSSAGSIGLPDSDTKEEKQITETERQSLELELVELEGKLLLLENDFPWLKGKSFQDEQKRVKQAGGNPYGFDAIRQSMRLQFLENRGKLKKRIDEDYRDAAHCLKTSEFASCLNMERTIAQTPGFPYQYASSIKPQNPGDYMATVECRWRMRELRQQTDEILVDSAINVALTVGTMGLSSAANAIRAGKLAMTAQAGKQMATAARFVDTLSVAYRARSELNHYEECKVGGEELVNSARQNSSALESRPLCPTSPYTGPSGIASDRACAFKLVGVIALTTASWAASPILARRMAGKTQPVPSKAPASGKVPPSASKAATVAEEVHLPYGATTVERQALQAVSKAVTREEAVLFEEMVQKYVIDPGLRKALTRKIQQLSPGELKEKIQKVLSKAGCGA